MRRYVLATMWLIVLNIRENNIVILALREVDTLDISPEMRNIADVYENIMLQINFLSDVVLY